jgi:outer membrane immunogenic protein
MKKLLVVGIAAAAFCGAPAIAADMPVKASPLFDWTGWYVGVNGGYSWGRSRITINGGTSLPGEKFTESGRHDGGEGSGEGGYCWQTRDGVTVTCIELRYDFPRERGRTPINNIPLDTSDNPNHVDPFLIGPHFGFLTDLNHTMWYLAGGLAVGEVGGSSTVMGAGGTSTANPGSKWTAGGYIGVGIEHMIDQHWSWKVEYDYVRFASSNGACATYTGGNYAVFGGGSACIGGNAYDNVVSAGINYHFGTH